MGYLVTNYGYEKVLKLLDGNIEARKKQLSVYFLTHDNEITPEQARYLSNVSMQVLLTGGQVLVHKVTADGFKTGRKKKAPKRKKERAEAKDVPNRRKKERIEAKDVARRAE